MTDPHVPLIPKPQIDAVAMAAKLGRTYRTERAAAFLLMASSAVCWLHAVATHYKSGRHELLMLDVMFPPFGIVCGALQYLGLL